VLFIECDANVLSFRVLARVLVVPHVARFGREDAVVAPEFAVLTREPRRAALAEDDVAGDDVFACSIRVSNVVWWWVGE
jgi:hypothetical protein